MSKATNRKFASRLFLCTNFCYHFVVCLLFAVGSFYLYKHVSANFTLMLKMILCLGYMFKVDIS